MNKKDSREFFNINVRLEIQFCRTTPPGSPILREGSDTGKYLNHADTNNARTERGAHTEHEKARLVPLSPSPRPAAQWRRDSRCSALDSVRFYGNNVRHWRIAVPTALPLLPWSVCSFAGCSLSLSLSFPLVFPFVAPIVPLCLPVLGLPPPRFVSSICDRDFRPPSTGRDWRRGGQCAACGGACSPRATALPFSNVLLPRTPSPATRTRTLGRVAPHRWGRRH